MTDHDLALLLQDAYHYALVAAGRESESAFKGTVSAHAALAYAYAKLTLAGEGPRMGGVWLDRKAPLEVAARVLLRQIVKRGFLRCIDVREGVVRQVYADTDELLEKPLPHTYYAAEAKRQLAFDFRTEEEKRHGENVALFLLTPSLYGKMGGADGG